MSRDVDKLISDTDKEIEKLKILKTKQEELKQLQAEIGVTDEKLSTKTKAEKRKKVKKHITFPKISLTPRTRKVVASAIVLCMVTMMMAVLVTRVKAADPAINFADPDDGGMFADTSDGDGVNWTINVSDGDTNLAWVRLYSNDSGSWVLFYESEALGGVAYHNASGDNENWTGSWTKYWYNISADDGTTHDTTYSFTTGYQWGDPQMAVLDDILTYDNAVILKNATGEYYLFYENGWIDVKTSDTGTNWSLEPKSADIDSGDYLSNCFTYNNLPYCLYYGAAYLYYGYWDGASWSTGSTGILQYYDNGINYRSTFADATYYNGVWNLVCGKIGATYENQLNHYTGTFPNTWTKLHTVVENSYHTYSSTRYSPWHISLAVHDGILHCIYKDPASYDILWQTYNGVTWNNKGGIGGDATNLGGATLAASTYYGCSMVKDPVNDQLVLIYINTSGDLMYRVTDNTTSWSDSSLILSKGSYDIRYPHIEYIDQRLVITISYNLRGNYNIYTISAPDYSGGVSGLQTIYNRIQFPDANPDDTNVNSTVFSLKNIDNRSIFTIMWHFEDIGEVANASNFEVWTNMSGAWTSIGTTGAGGDVATLDISGLMAGGTEWIVGQSTWWKVEILAVGSVSEDIHTTDEDIYYKITFA